MAAASAEAGQASSAFVTLFSSQNAIVERVIGVDMAGFIRLCVLGLTAALGSCAALPVENLALRHQLWVYQRSVKRAKVKPAEEID